jgi:phage-related minor tail protein
MTDATSFDRDAERRAKQLTDLNRLAQRFGTSLSSAFARNVQEGNRLDKVLGKIGRTLLNASLRAAMKPLKSGLQDLLKNAFASSATSDAADAGEAASALAKGGVVSRGQVMPFAKGGVVAAPTYFPLARGMGLMEVRY